ncbi:MAG: DNA-directed RNA polymerase subunit G [Candidatus Helarchaeota archaeon]
MLQFETKVIKIEPTETSGVSFIYFSSNKGELKLELPDKINYFTKEDEIKIRLVDEDKPEDDDKLFVKGFIYSNTKTENDKRIILISIGGLIFKLVMEDNSELTNLKPKHDIYIGFK